MSIFMEYVRILRILSEKNFEVCLVSFANKFSYAAYSDDWFEYLALSNFKSCRYEPC